MTLDAQLRTLERAELIQLAHSLPELEYQFRHALMQEAAYASLLRADRSVLHLRIADLLERLYPEQAQAQAALLARHFEAAGEPARALPHFVRAADQAASKHANAEALLHFSSALAMAAQAGIPRAMLLHRRGRVFELVGADARARADYESALAEAEASGDGRARWQALLDLGFLWSARDYARTGDYLRLAHAQAEVVGDPRLIAESLNRLGNWHLHSERPQEALRHHQQALALYEQAGDTSGVAATSDLLGITGAGSGDLALLAVSCRRAIALFRELGSLRDLATNLASSSLRVYCSFSAVLVEDRVAVRATFGDLDEAAALTRQIGWVPGEAFAQAHRAQVALGAGELGLALGSAREGLRLGEQVAHAQWTMLAQYALGETCFHAGMVEEGWVQSLAAVHGARAIGSTHLERTAAGVLAVNAARFGTPEQRAAAETELVLALGADARVPTAITIGQRHCWIGRAALRLAKGDASGALTLVEALDQTLPNREAWGTHFAPEAAELRGGCLLALGHREEAERVLGALRSLARDVGAHLLGLRVAAQLASVQRAKGAADAAADAEREATELAQTVAATIPDAALRRGFLEHTLAGLGA